jgi:hypothetical protein
MPYASGELQSDAQAHYNLPSAPSPLKWLVGGGIYSHHHKTSHWATTTTSARLPDSMVPPLDSPMAATWLAVGS